MPAATTLPLPLTGDARNWVPTAAQAARIASEVSVETVEVSTTTAGTLPGVGDQAAVTGEHLLEVLVRG